MSDERTVFLYVGHRADGEWGGVLALDGRKVSRPIGDTRAGVLADLLDALLANDVDIDPCCAADGEGAH